MYLCLGPKQTYHAYCKCSCLVMHKSFDNSWASAWWPFGYKEVLLLLLWVWLKAVFKSRSKVENDRPMLCLVKNYVSYCRHRVQPGAPAAIAVMPCAYLLWCPVQGFILSVQSNIFLKECPQACLSEGNCWAPLWAKFKAWNWSLFFNDCFNDWIIWQKQNSVSFILMRACKIHLHFFTNCLFIVKTLP